MSNTITKTSWFPLAATPAANRVGEYEATRPSGRGRPRVERIYWNGRRWCLVEDRRVALPAGAYRSWRGLKQPARSMVIE